MSMTEFSTANYDDILHSKKPVVVDFWASWCAPCKTMAPAFAEIAKDTPHAKFGTINVETSPELAGNLGVMSLPTVLVYKSGAVVGAIQGAQPKAALKRKIMELIETPV